MVATGCCPAPGRTARSRPGSTAPASAPAGRTSRSSRTRRTDLIPKACPGGSPASWSRLTRGGKVKPVASITKFERANDPDSEGPDCDPYSLLALKNQVLVADAAGDFIARVPTAGSPPGPCCLSTARRSTPFLPSSPEARRQDLRRRAALRAAGQGEGVAVRPRRATSDSWGHFTTVTGVARAKDGTLYVSELFGGKCTLRPGARPASRAASSGWRRTAPARTARFRSRRESSSTTARSSCRRSRFRRRVALAETPTGAARSGGSSTRADAS